MSKPLITVGIPVYNGEMYLAHAIESIRSQTVQDFEIVICDNGSTDRTGEVAAAFASKDSRIRYFKNEVNLGPLKNFNRVFELASDAKYFKFAPHDDFYASTYLEECIHVLEEDPGVVLCSSRVAIVNGKGEFFKDNDLPIDASSAKASDRFLVLLNNSKCFELFAVIRKEALNRMPSPLLPIYAHTDGVLISRLGLLGRFHTVAKPLYFNRDYKDRSGNKYKTYQEYVYFLDPSRVGSVVFPRWRMGWEFARSIFLFPLPKGEKRACLTHMCRWVTWYWPSLAWNIVVAAKTSLRRLTGPFCMRGAAISGGANARD